MLIGELSARTGVSPRLLRYYERQGLLDSDRGPNGYRTYDDDAVGTVRQIRALLAAGLGTEVIRTVLPCANGDASRLDLCPRLVETLRRELTAMDDRIDNLRQVRGTLAAYLPEG
ncbi:DNA-binding transcriptional MerR regulator [Herbihabitans rhizosphaerae]|uniref:DNA-binding transcriptional MerR regulator n=1 Tax=Herbihabitans rhizosphaerae TaxID=1872711 RepID=A0A4Q7L7T5_9PSEU|nr:MerR family transcriptional regulator [Herbihabitans rhizosphaerae]RZS44701.1 DNA-binding transcriptional MerR regulator [Herbihabitans rhizosphaerae]